jgi:N-acetyl-alpha-D-muramate 1-phosphate uridylyltransferase
MTHALILAAGRGERMRPLSDTVPKPLLAVGGKALIAWQVERLVAGGITEIVVNHSHLGAQLEAALGDGARFGASIRHSREETALETAGGIARALPMLGGGPFVVVSGDIWTEYPYRVLHDRAAEIAAGYPSHAAHLVLVDNPAYHLQGDMALHGGRVAREGRMLTYGNIGVFDPRSFASLDPDHRLALFPWAYAMVEAGQVSGEHYRGRWANLGTPQDLEELDRELPR